MFSSIGVSIITLEGIGITSLDSFWDCLPNKSSTTATSSGLVPSSFALWYASATFVNVSTFFQLLLLLQ